MNPQNVGQLIKAIETASSQNLTKKDPAIRKPYISEKTWELVKQKQAARERGDYESELSLRKETKTAARQDKLAFDDKQFRELQGGKGGMERSEVQKETIRAKPLKTERQAWEESAIWSKVKCSRRLLSKRTMGQTREKRTTYATPNTGTRICRMENNGHHNGGTTTHNRKHEEEQGTWSRCNHGGTSKIS